MLDMPEDKTKDITLEEVAQIEGMDPLSHITRKFLAEIRLCDYAHLEKEKEALFDEIEKSEAGKKLAEINEKLCVCKGQLEGYVRDMDPNEEGRREVTVGEWRAYIQKREVPKRTWKIEEIEKLPWAKGLLIQTLDEKKFMKVAKIMEADPEQYCTTVINDQSYFVLKKTEPKEEKANGNE